MPGAQVRAETVAVGQGQHTPRCGDPAVPDDHCAVVEGGILKENVPDQLLGNLTVDLGAGFEVFLQPLLPGEDDQRAHLFPPHGLAGTHGLGNDRVHLLLYGLVDAEDTRQLHAAQMIQHPPQLRLEQNHQRQQSDGQELVHDEAHRVQMQEIRQPRDDQHRDHGLGDPGGAGCLDQRKNFIYQKRDYGDIQIV